MKFNELNLDPLLLKAIARVGFQEPTPIQAATIPLVLKGVDVIGQAQTGTGKTAAFGLPMLNAVDVDNPAIQGLIISPTRELAIQTQEELQRLGKDKHVRVQVVFGGADINRQIRNLKQKPQIVVGTPGRLIDHIERHTLKLDKLKMLVLDEADEMLDMGFVDDIEKIAAHVPSQRQTLLFSATMPPAIMKIAHKFMQDPQVVRIETKELTADLIDQYYVRAREDEKFDILTRLLDVQNPELALVFGRTKRRVDELIRGLKARGFNAEGIHGDLTQQKRMTVLRAFRAGELDILVATDVAARGLDISGVTHVYNYDIPQDPDSYVHRIGRTGRAGQNGISVTFVTPNELGYLRTIEHLTKKRLLPLKPPTNRDAFRGRLQQTLINVHTTLTNTDELKRYATTAAQLLDEYDPMLLVAAYLHTINHDDIRNTHVRITPERPLPTRKRSRNDHHHHDRHYHHHDHHDQRPAYQKHGKMRRVTKKNKHQFKIRTNA
ncbi:MAG: DEAD/DEAH box helicase [Candidatus Paralactobacillus gallistercoris]|uniref:ATP-dependent RNA helicase CshA n=1 Tax=Candidatus Paralactobacillus gallistercoris TaxID=2838724 RepID=A0A948TKB3_9LACO|nr:DEAD/DEAH box helicase [Candidatus Paralactobacillus gallistercoris]